MIDTTRITRTPLQRSDLRSGAFDSRVISVLAWVGRRHSITVTALKFDRSYIAASGNACNHSAYRT